MLNENKREEKLVYFKPGLNKRMFTSLAFVALMFVLIAVFMKPLGMGNAMALSMCLFFVLSSAQNDYTDQPVANTFILIGLQLLAGVLSIFALNNLWTQLATFVGLTFFAVYILSNDRFKPFYRMYLINFILMCYYPVTGKDIYVRLIILEASAVILMMLQFIVHRKGFDKKVRAGIEQAFAAVRADVKNINSDGPDEKFNSAEGKINKEMAVSTYEELSINKII